MWWIMLPGFLKVAPNSFYFSYISHANITFHGSNDLKILGNAKIVYRILQLSWNENYIWHTRLINSDEIMSNYLRREYHKIEKKKKRSFGETKRNNENKTNFLPWTKWVSLFTENWCIIGHVDLVESECLDIEI